MWPKGVIPLGKDAMRRQVDVRLLSCAQLQASRILGSVQVSYASQARGGAGRANVLQHGFVTDQRLAGPVLADRAK